MTTSEEQRRPRRGAVRPGGSAALLLTGGGARGAYQVGFLRCLARHLPEVKLPILTGVSAGALNAAYLAARPGSLGDAVERLSELWRQLTPEQVFRVSRWSLFRNALRWGVSLVSGGGRAAPQVRSLLATDPLRRLLQRSLGCVDEPIPGIADNVASGRVKALALTTLKYATGQTVTWVEGRGIDDWERPDRLGVNCRMTIDHVMASAALPLIFPAVRIGDSWYGDGVIRMFTPLAPAIHLGADRILAISTRYARSREEASTPTIDGYPPVAQVAGALLNAVFLDALDHDALRLQRVNELLARLPDAESDYHRPIRLLVLRPSRDLGRLAAEYEPRLPPGFRFLSRGLGTRRTRSPDFLSLLMFQGNYTSRLMEIGERDAEARRDEIAALLTGP